MEIRIVKEPVKRKELADMAKSGFGDVVKAAVDIEKEIMAVGGEMHMDELVLLIEQEGSKQEHVWGINLYPERIGDGFIEFDSMINLKPAFGNRTRHVDDPSIREKVETVADKLVLS